VKKTLFIMAALAATAGMGVFGTWVAAQNTPAPATPPATKPTLKIGIVNLNMVLKEFKKANAMGESLIKQAQEKENQIKAQEDAIRKQVIEAQKLTDTVARDAQIKALEKQQFDLSGVVADQKKAFTKLQSDMAVAVYDNVRQVIDSIARTQGLEMVLTYPDITDEKERGKPPDAFRILSNTGTMVAWKHPGLDITDSVIATLNHYFPPPPGVITTGGTAPTK
jgi:Skp family chaperone for outer membrane proteins